METLQSLICAFLLLVGVAARAPTRASRTLDFLSAENDYRSVQLNYTNLVLSYLTAAAELGMAVGREVIP